MKCHACRKNIDLTEDDIEISSDHKYYKHAVCDIVWETLKVEIHPNKKRKLDSDDESSSSEDESETEEAECVTSANV